MTRELTGHVSVALGRELAAEVEQLAASRLISRSALLKQIIVEHLAGLGRAVSAPRGRTASRKLLERAAG